MLGAVGALLAVSASAGAAPHIRVDQVGFAPAETKVAYVLAPRAIRGARFRVTDAGGRTVLRGRVRTSRGRWSRRFRAVQPLDLSALREPGRYRVRVGRLRSPRFRIAAPAKLLGPRVAESVAFFQAQRDGADVIPGPLDRRPAHLRDARARVYAAPRYDGRDSDVIRGRTLRAIGGPVDVAGGWFDAGDFIKFTHTTAYASALLLIARRELGAAAPPQLEPEARFGLDWLDKAWQDDGSLLLQVGIGSGNAAGTFNGDHDLWRLPERDDGLESARNRYLRDRPVFRANGPGEPVPPNLAGRVSAAFALAAQLDATAEPARARAELATGAAVFAAARTTGVRDVATALPHAFYPESSWRDDLELGAAELALAGRALGDPRAGEWLRQSAGWARDYLAEEAGEETLNLYDTSAVAHAELIRAGRVLGAPVGEPALLRDLRAQLGRGVRRARHDPFRAGMDYAEFDSASHGFGLVATAALYRQLTGARRYDRFATAQRDWLLGANAWGVSMVIGVGTRSPRCPQHVVANLSGGRDGYRPRLLGAVVGGPNDRSLFSGGLGDFFEDSLACPSWGGDRFREFTGHGSRFVDDVRAWQTVEPAIDFTATATLAFALAQ